MELDQMGEPRALRRVRGVRRRARPRASADARFPGNGPVQQLLKARSGRTSVPQVFVNDAFLGGNDEIVGLGAGLRSAVSAALP